MLYRIFTEHKNLKEVEKIVNKYFEGYTIIKSEGYWRLQAEKSLIIEVACPKTKKGIVNKLAKDIKKANTQEAVLIQEIKNNNWLV